MALSRRENEELLSQIEGERGRMTHEQVLESLKRQIYPEVRKEVLTRQEAEAQPINLTNTKQIILVKKGAKVGSVYAHRRINKFRYDRKTGQKLGINPAWKRKVGDAETRRAAKIGQGRLKSKYLYGSGLNVAGATAKRFSMAMEKAAAGRSTKRASKGLSRALMAMLGTNVVKPPRQPRLRQPQRFQRMPQSFMPSFDEFGNPIQNPLQRHQNFVELEASRNLSGFNDARRYFLKALEHSYAFHNQKQALKSESLRLNRQIHTAQSNIDRQGEILRAENCFSREADGANCIDLQENIFSSSNPNSINLMAKRADSIDILHTGRRNILQTEPSDNILNSRYRLRFGGT